MREFQYDASAAPPLRVDEAQARIIEAVVPGLTELVALADLAGRVLREPVFARRDVPAADNSAMDGYAVRAADLHSPSADGRVRLPLAGEIAAGGASHRPLEPGSALRIMTGASMPAGADCVIPVELTDAEAGYVAIHQAAPAGANVRRRGEDMAMGSLVLDAGATLGAAETGVIAAAGHTHATVARKTRVAIVNTGDELAEPGELSTTGVINSNALTISQLVRDAGGEPHLQPVVRDSLDETRRVLESAFEYDVVITTGGVSVGAYDFVRAALAAIGVETLFWRVAMKPGKPVMVSRRAGRLCFSLPGNPVSCMVAFHLFVRPALRKMAGAVESSWFPPAVRMPVSDRIRGAEGKDTYVRVRVSAREGLLMATPLARQGSGMTTSMAGANGLALVERDQGVVEAGALAPVLIIGELHGH